MCDLIVEGRILNQNNLKMKDINVI